MLEPSSGETGESVSQHKVSSLLRSLRSGCILSIFPFPPLELGIAYCNRSLEFEHYKSSWNTRLNTNVLAESKITTLIKKHNQTPTK